MGRILAASALLIVLCAAGNTARAAEAEDAVLKQLWDDYASLKNESAEEKKLRDEMKACKHKLVFETNRDGGVAEIYVMNADGSNQTNLTNTPDCGEYYPHASYDGKKICFVAADGKFVFGQKNQQVGTPTVCVMDADGKNREKLFEWGASPAWHPSGDKIAFTKVKKGNWSGGIYGHNSGLGNIAHTEGMAIYDLKTKKTTDIPCTGKIGMVFNICYSPCGKYLIFKTHNATSFKRSILIVDIEKDWIIPAQHPGTGGGGCRPDWSWDGKSMAWNASDSVLMRADFVLADLAKDKPEQAATTNPIHIASANAGWGAVYFIDWSPDGKYMAFARQKKHSLFYHHPFANDDARKLPADQNALVSKIDEKAAHEYNVWIARSEGTDKAHIRANYSIPITFSKIGSDEEPDWVVVK